MDIYRNTPKFDPMELKVCSMCLIPAIKIIEFYNHEQYLFSRSQEFYNKKLNLCTECIVGKKLPLFRKRHGTWDDVKIMSFDDQTYEHRILLSTGSFDTVILDSRPFEAYYSHLERKRNRDGSQEHDLHILTSQQTHEYKEHLSTAMNNSIIPSHRNLLVRKKNLYQNSFQPSCLPVIELSEVVDRYQPQKNIERNDSIVVAQFHRPSSCFNDVSTRPNISIRKEFDFVEEGFDVEYHRSCNRTSSEINILRRFNCEFKEKTLKLQDGPDFFDSHFLTHYHPSESSGRSNFSNEYFLKELRPREVSLESRDECKSWTSTRKKKPKQWTTYEDEALLDLVSVQSNPIQWNVISQQLPFERSSKQCRERFLNYINPQVKRGPWTIVEDVVIINLYTIFGAQWVRIASCIPGRTDNSIKNRFHHLRRKMEKDSEMTEKNGNLCGIGKELKLKLNEKFKRKQEETKFQKKMSNVEGYTVANVLSLLPLESKLEKLNSTETNTHFRPVVPGEQCKRCFLFLPSKQCGKEICVKNQWCKSCTKIHAYISRDSLYRCLWLVGETQKTNMFKNGFESKQAK